MTRAQRKRIDKKLRQECQLCSAPCLDDSDYCAPHRDSERKRNKEAQRRRRAANQQPTANLR